jgi:hypothetical protein
MNTVTVSLLFLFLIAITNTTFAGQGSDAGDEEPDCDYSTGVDTAQ